MKNLLNFIQGVAIVGAVATAITLFFYNYNTRAHTTTELSNHGQWEETPQLNKSGRPVSVVLTLKSQHVIAVDHNGNKITE